MSQPLATPHPVASLSWRDLKNVVAVCTSCNHWQADLGPKPSRIAETPLEAVALLALANAEHLADCPGGTTGRVKVLGQWVERPKMSNGAPADGLLAMFQLPAWWVWR